jgi:hypothetical protein
MAFKGILLAPSGSPNRTPPPPRAHECFSLRTVSWVAMITPFPVVMLSLSRSEVFTPPSGNIRLPVPPSLCAPREWKMHDLTRPQNPSIFRAGQGEFPAPPGDPSDFP